MDVTKAEYIEKLKVLQQKIEQKEKLTDDEYEFMIELVEEYCEKAKDANPVMKCVTTQTENVPKKHTKDAATQTEFTFSAIPLAFLRTQLQFQHLRQMLQTNPQLFNTVLQQIRQNDPQFFQLITQNQEAFVQMLNEPSSVPSGRGSVPQGGGGGTGGSLKSGLAHATMQVTPQDKEAIEKLKALDFPEYLVVQAYFACDKNENLAANFLLTQNYDE